MSVSLIKHNTSAFYLNNLRILKAHILTRPELRLAQYQTITKCGTLFCIAGEIPHIPHFQALGVAAFESGAPYMVPTNGGPTRYIDSIINYLFGSFYTGLNDFGDTFYYLCADYRNVAWDKELIFNFIKENSRSPTDKELALARIDKAIQFHTESGENHA